MPTPLFPRLRITLLESARNTAIRTQLHKCASHSAEEVHRVAEVLASSSTATAPTDVGLIAKHAEGSGDKSKL